MLVGHRDIKPRPEFAELLFVEFLLLVGYVFAFAGFAETVAFNGARQNYGGRAAVLDGGFVSSVNLPWVVAAEAQAPELLVGQRFHQFQQLRAGTEEMFADVIAGRDDQLLIFAVNHLSHAFYQQAFGVALENGIPLGAPENLDHVPSGAAELGLELLNDLAVAAYGTVQTLQVAVHNKDKIVEFFSGGQTDSAERFRFVGLAIAEKGPDFGVRYGLEAAIFEISVESRLVDGHQGTESHGNRGEFPECGHEPGMRIRSKTAVRLQFTPKIFKLIRGETPLQKRARINSGRCVALEINDVAFELRRVRAEEMVESNFIQSCRGRIGGNVPANVVLFAVRAHNHGNRVPADQAFDPPFQLLIAREVGLQAVGDGIYIGGLRGEGNVDSHNLGVRPQALQNVRSNLGAA